MGGLVVGRIGDGSVFRGTTSASVTLGRVPLVDPLAALEVTLSQRVLIGEVWLGAGLLILVAALLGPIFCGWICPLGFLMDLTQTVRGFIQKRVLKRRWVLPQWTLPAGLRTPILVGALSFSLVAQIPLFQAISPIHGVARALVFGLDSAVVLALILLLAEFVAPRLWCRSLCPLGALYSLIGRFALLRVRVHPDRAGQIRCGRCDVACPMGILVMEDYALAGQDSVLDPSCTRCGACIDTCPNSVLRLGFKETRGLPPSETCDACSLDHPPDLP
jgi:ferredoxin-type protein NapH